MHVLFASTKTLMAGLSTDPLYSLMLSKCVSKNRIIFKVKKIVNYKILDYQLLKSKTLIDNFDFLNGDEKYYSLINMFSILLFIQNNKLNRNIVEKKIEDSFNIKIKDIKENVIEKKGFLMKYKKIYNQTFKLIMRNLKWIEIGFLICLPLI